MDVTTLDKKLQEALIQVAAALSAEVPDLEQDPDISIEFKGRSATITADYGNVEASQEMLVNRVFDKLDERALEINSVNPQQVINEEIAPINDYSPEEEKKEESGSSSVKDVVLNS